MYFYEDTNNNFIEEFLNMNNSRTLSIITLIPIKINDINKIIILRTIIDKFIVLFFSLDNTIKKVTILNTLELELLFNKSKKNINIIETEFDNKIKFIIKHKFLFTINPIIISNKFISYLSGDSINIKNIPLSFVYFRNEVNIQKLIINILCIVLNDNKVLSIFILNGSIETITILPFNNFFNSNIINNRFLFNVRINELYKIIPQLYNNPIYKKELSSTSSEDLLNFYITNIGTINFDNLDSEELDDDIFEEEIPTRFFKTDYIKIQPVIIQPRQPRPVAVQPRQQLVVQSQQQQPHQSPQQQQLVMQSPQQSPQPQQQQLIVQSPQQQQPQQQLIVQSPQPQQQQLILQSPQQQQLIVQSPQQQQLILQSPQQSPQQQQLIVQSPQQQQLIVQSPQQSPQQQQLIVQPSWVLSTPQYKPQILDPMSTCSTRAETLTPPSLFCSPEMVLSTRTVIPLDLPIHPLAHLVRRI